ncbi:ABC transporter ATP-binding protein [Reyranella sp. CPCC 100927]|uniref:ABC transporter ATP-binding protein n=1 Tax=Reyranella sp. CPCC 100927 TaxID=2599616 RepID=UPI0011B5CEDA|nr:ABC transporter ATP-binding protein [Reyranella sp. CPCC 100927]TWT11595.1 ABC transporter ATP-binding protein [Reyranella sp. CPCC 100927]
MSGTDTALLEIRDLSVAVGTDEGTASILDGVNLRLTPGSIHGVVGESGCGKSTLIKAILGLLPARGRATEGSITLQGRALLAAGQKSAAQSARGRDIGFIPQDPLLALNPVFRVGDQLREAMWQYGMSADDPQRNQPRAVRRRVYDQRLVELLRAVQLPDPEQALQRYPHQFSGGQRQRLLIAAALACGPQIVLADEPTTALDVTTQLQILKLLRQLARERGLSMLFVTHDFGVVAQLCDTVTVMYAGQTIESGPVAATMSNPRHPYTRMLLACHPERSQELKGIPGAVPSPLRAPSGCRFHPRCPEMVADCQRARPEAVSGAARMVACVHCHEVAA